MKYIELVREFNTACNCGAPTSPGLPGLPTDNQRIIRFQCIAEELAEVVEAVAARDLIWTLRETCDLQYVIDGAFVIYAADKAGLTIPGWDSNAAGPPMLPMSIDASMMHLTAMARGAAEVGATMIGGGDWKTIATVVLELRSMLATWWTALRVPDELRWDMFQALHVANMTKRTAGVNAAGRVQKPKDWQPADFEAVLKEHGYTVPAITPYMAVQIAEAQGAN